MIDHARREAPRECCGLLVGAGCVVERAVPARNVAESPQTRYLIDPADQFSVIRDLRGSAREIVGAYHSHPASPAVASPTDLAEAWPPPFVYVIVSLQDATRPDVRACWMDNGKALPVAVMVGPA